MAADPAPDAGAGYGAEDVARWLPEQHSGRRSDFARDRARVVHATSFRRLASITQVLSPAASLDFARNRLTHSLEVAQIGRELAVALGLAAEVVDAACLSHDIGHPPFGHNGESALDEWAADIGGFEGNAQTLRVLTRLEPKVWGVPVGGGGPRALGLNLTRATLDACTKYPWRRGASPTGSRKFGVYADDAGVFDWIRDGAPESAVCIEAQAMDLADDVAYSVHDVEDAILGGYIHPALFDDPVARREVIEGAAVWVGSAWSVDELGAAFDRVWRLGHWAEYPAGSWRADRHDRARLKNTTSAMIGRFAGAAIEATRAAYPAESLVRYRAAIVVPRETEAEIAVLKGVVGASVMSINDRQPVYARQREILIELAEACWAAPDALLEPDFAEDWGAAPDDSARKRVVVDQVAALSDASAQVFHEQLVAPR